MNIKDKVKLESLIKIALIVFIFIIGSLLIQKNIEQIKELIGGGFLSIILYILLLTIAVVIAPINTMVLIPIASNVWGWFLSGVYSIIGWSIGAYISFCISRRYGVSLVNKIIPMEKIWHFEKLVPKENFFWSIVLLRIITPVDILSYVLGLFTHIDKRRYILATILGISPFAFIFSYIGEIPLYYQLMILILIIIIILVGYIYKSK